MTRRALVLTHESAGHWFRRSLPPHVFTISLSDEVEDREARRRWQLNGGDWQGFLSAYCTSFLAIVTFIA